MLLPLHGILQLVPLLGFELTPDRYPLITDVLTIALTPDRYPLITDVLTIALHRHSEFIPTVIHFGLVEIL